MSRLRVYTVHVDPSLPHPYEEAEFIEEGLNVKAFLFGFLWTLYHRMWWPSIVVFCVNLMIAFLMAGTLAGAAAECGWNLIIGFLANDWLREELKKRGYIIADIVTGDSLLRAEQRFFDRYFHAHNPVMVS